MLEPQWSDAKKQMEPEAEDEPKTRASRRQGGTMRNEAHICRDRGARG